MLGLTPVRGYPFLLAVSMAACLAVSAGAQVFGYGGASGALVRVDLETGVGVVLGDLDPAIGSFEALTFGPDGLLYGVSRTGLDYALQVIDPDSAIATQVGAFVLDVTPSSLAFDAEGRLLMSAADRIYELDTGSGTPILRHALARPVQALASRDSEIFAVTEGNALERLDLETGQLTPIFALGLPSPVVAASFDFAGDLRLGTVGGGILSHISLYYHLVDLAGQTVSSTYTDGYHFTRPEAHVRGLAMPGAPVVAVPALGPAALLALGVLLAVAGLLVLCNPG